MKKILSAILTLILICSCSAVCFAAEVPDTESQNVYAKYVGSESTAEVPVPDGEDKIVTELPDGTDVTVDDVPTGAKAIVIRPIPKTETEAHKWFAECLKDKGKPLAVYEIYFLKADGSRLSVNGAKITIDCPKADNPIVCSILATDGKTNVLSSEVKDGKIIFTADGGTYFSITEKKADNTNIPGTNGDAPQTGDNSHMWLWWLLLVVSIAAMLGIWGYGKRKKKV